MHTHEEIRSKVSERIEFMADHWTTEDKSPFNFGGWKEEVIDEIMQLLVKHEEEIAVELEKEKKYFAQLAMTEDVYAWNEALSKAISILTKKEGEKE